MILSAAKGVSSRLVKSSPSMGTMLMVGFSAAPMPNTGTRVLPLAPVKGGGRSGAGGKVVGRRDVGDAGKVDRIVVAGPGNVEQELPRQGIGERAVVAENRLFEGEGRDTGRERGGAEPGEDTDAPPGLEAASLPAGRVVEFTMLKHG